MYDDLTEIEETRLERETKSTTPSYNSGATLDSGVRALESFISVGAHGIVGETRRLTIHMN